MMERLDGYVFPAVCSCHFLISCLLFSRITGDQRDPYMDETFHVPQAQTYCRGGFTEWDPMITTLPGLYLLSVGIIKPLVLLFGWTGRAVCSIAMLRFINVLFTSGNLYVLYLIICKVHSKDKSRTTGRRVLSALTLSTFPVLYFFTFLYYTDSGSTFFTLFTYLMCLYRCHKAAALLAVCAVLFRQTNVVWVAFCAGTVLAQKMDETWKAEQSKKRDEKSTPQGLQSSGRIAQFVIKYVTSVTNLKNLVLLTWPYGVAGLGFLVFVILNDGIVVGDRTSHEACLNFPQLFYFCSLALVFSLPATLCYQRVVRFLQSVRKHPVLFLLIAALSLSLIWRFTFVHKYLLADNRHFPFYVWMRIYQRHELVRFLLVPVYLYAAWNLLDTLKSRSVFWILAFCVCLVAATVPQKLLEFRYFILPYLFYRIHIPLPSLPRLLIEFALYTAVNAATICLFLYKTFQWPDSPAVQRFMW